MIPAGRYVGIARDANLGFTDRGKEQVAVEFEILEGPHTGERRTWYGYFTEATQQRTLEALRFCGWDNDDIFELLPSVTRNKVQLTIEHDEYQDKVRDKIAWVNRLGGLAIKNPMSDQQKRQFSARMKMAAKGVPKNLADPSPDTRPTNGSQAVPVHQDSDYLPTDSGSDDIPF